MPVKLGKKKYEKFSDASAAIQKKKGISNRKKEKDNYAKDQKIVLTNKNLEDV
jgi:hypothetical protein